MYTGSQCKTIFLTVNIGQKSLKSTDLGKYESVNC